ncbi:MAG: UDP-N-acetyl-D-glucosamine dehydrogenase [Ectothiorhodospiraceae bacterium]|nr:UDP-N-acetyl-D-glucosamine dehydrogenase [Ectothiorhodospiraceae bacterium]
MDLEQKIADRSLKIGVVGLGYVGLPLAMEFAKKGIQTIGIDVDPWKVDSLNAGKNYIQDVRDEDVAQTVKDGTFYAENHFESVPDMDVIYICVPTPFTPNKEPDISYIVDSAENTAKGLRKGQLVILKSTTFPDTTEGVVQPILEKSGLKLGEDFFLAFSPERIDPGNKLFTTHNTPVVVGGVTQRCTKLAADVNRLIIDEIVEVSNPKVAEMEKLLENIFRSVNIALVNEMAALCDRIGGINIWEVVDAAKTKPFGFMPFYPGPGIGGHCILIDPYYLSWAARKYDFQTKFINLAAETNEDMPYYVKNMIFREISMLPISIIDAKVLILGVAFKRDVDDTRHSPALRIMELLFEDHVQNILYNDPYVDEITVDGHEMKSQELTPELLKSVDCVVITTDHSVYDYDMILEHSKCVVDTRNATKNAKVKKDNVVVLGDGLN